jgi:cation:H+ antiporter
VVFALDGVLMPLEGLLLLLFFSFFLIATCRKERQAVAPEEAAGSLKRLLVLFAFAAVGLFVGARLLVFGGAGLAREALVSAGLSPLEAEAAVGFTVVALGTSLPELATILISIKRRFYEISLGTVIGSNIFNIGLIAGTASIATAAVGGALLVDEQAIRLGNPAMIALSALLAVFTVNRKSLARWQGAVLMLLYISYMGLMGAFYSL